MGKISSSALSLLERFLASPGAVSEQTADLEVGNVQGVLDVANLVAAGQGGLDQGFYLMLVSQVHAGAGTLTETFDPYAAGNTFLNGTREPSLDLWIHGVVAEVSAAMTNAIIALDPSALTRAVTDGTTALSPFTIAQWGVFTTIAARIVGIQSAAASPFLGYTKLGFRMPRNWDGLFHASTSPGVATITFSYIVEDVPEGGRPSTFAA